jgi:phospholipase C
MAAAISNIFVLMLENRSFDHMLGFSGLPGVPEPPTKFGFTPGAVDKLAHDPPHEFDNVAAQIHGGMMDGFSGSGGPDTMLGFDAPKVSVLIELAKNNLYFDNWFSSMPGPTWPNRLFAHAASSGGLDNSLSAIDAGGAVTNPGSYLDFENGHIFDRLVAKGVSWRVYHQKTNLFDYPQVLCLKGMVSKWTDRNFFRPFSQFKSDMLHGDVAGYTFIEPKYDLPSYSNGNSQHPTGKISPGEVLIKDVYTAIFKQSVGAHSALLITWDEHGGFFDHVTPPAAVPPGDSPLNHNRAKLPRNFVFDRFGVRVPAVLISPWLPAGLGSDVFGKNSTFDHSSIVRALRSTFALDDANRKQLTNRDKASPDWNSKLLATPRTIKLNLPAVAVPKHKTPVPSIKEVAASGPPSGNLLGISQIAVDIDWYTAERLRVPPHITSDFEEKMKNAQAVLSQPSDTVAPVELTEAHLAVLQYIAAVHARDVNLQAAQGRSSATKKAAPKSPIKKRSPKRPRHRGAR